jgi:hypothetical protein
MQQELALHRYSQLHMALTDRFTPREFASHLITAILLRSIVTNTATMRAAPKTIC